MGNDENNEEVVDQQSENANTGENQNTDNGGSDDKNEPEKTFTQAQVNKMMAKEKQQGKSSVYKELGINPEDKAAVAAIKAFIDAQKTKEQKEAEQKSESESKVNEAEARAAKAEAKATALAAGANPEFVDDIVALAMVKVDDDNDVESVIEELKEKYSFWFSDEEKSGDSAEDKKNSVGKRGTGSSVGGKKSSSNQNSSAKGIGKRLAAARKPSSSAKKSYWD